MVPYDVFPLVFTPLYIPLSFSNLLLTNRLWQCLSEITSVIMLQRVVTFILIESSIAFIACTFSWCHLPWSRTKDSIQPIAMEKVRFSFQQTGKAWMILVSTEKHENWNFRFDLKLWVDLLILVLWETMTQINHALLTDSYKLRDNKSVCFYLLSFWVICYATNFTFIMMDANTELVKLKHLWCYLRKQFLAILNSKGFYIFYTK